MGWGWGYSKVKDCTRQHWPNLPTVHTVTRLVKMEVSFLARAPVCIFHLLLSNLRKNAVEG